MTPRPLGSLQDPTSQGWEPLGGRLFLKGSCDIWCPQGPLRGLVRDRPPRDHPLSDRNSPPIPEHFVTPKGDGSAVPVHSPRQTLLRAVPMEPPVPHIPSKRITQSVPFGPGVASVTASSDQPEVDLSPWTVPQLSQ